MTRKDFRVVGQMKQPFDDVRTQLLIIASRQIGAADAATEKRIASEDPTFHHSIKTDASHGMAWRADDFESALSHLDDLAIFQIDIRKVAVTQKQQSEHGSLLPRTKEVIFHIGMRSYLDAVTLFHWDVTHNMVDMAMRIDDHQRFEAMSVDEPEKLVFLACIRAARVDDDTFFGIVVIDDICVFPKGIEDKRFELEHDFNISAQR